MKISPSWLLFMFLAGATGSVPCSAVNGTIVPEQEYAKKIKATERTEQLTSSLFGDSVSLYNGTVEFTQVDIDLPGNNALPVRLARRLKVEARAQQETIGGFADWEIEVPYIHAVVDKNVGWVVQGSNPNARCSAGLPPKMSTPHFRLDEVWHGTYMHIPGEGGRELYKSDQPKIPAVADGQQYPWITRDYYRIRCAATSSNGYPGESFIAVSPQGLKYYFSHGSHVLASTLGKGTEYPEERVERYHVYFRATRVEDRFGNFVDYTYVGNQLASIIASDGRSIAITHTSGKISQATTNGRTWTYSYRPETVNADEILQTVGLPDGSSWTFNWPGVPRPAYDAYPAYEEERPDCPEIPAGGGTRILTMRHPSGALGEFTHGEIRHRRDGVSGVCVVRGPGYQAWTIQNFFDNYALTSKKISGNSVPTMEWNYDYETGATHISPVMGACLGCNTTKDVIVTNPDGTKVYHRFGVTFGVNEGRLLREEKRDAVGNAVRVMVNGYIAESAIPAMPFSDKYGHSYLIGDSLSTSVRPVTTTNIEQDGVIHTSSISAFDVFARPVTIVKSNTLGSSKTDGVEYEDHLGLWVIGQPKRSTTNGVETSRVTYTSATALPIAGYRFDKLIQTVAYNTDGTVGAVTDGRNNTTVFSNWKRGIPQLIQHPATPEAPAGATESATVNDNGWITSVTDENGYATGYGYDAMGRLASIVQPTGDSVAYHNTLMNFRALTDADWKPPGVASGQWRLYEETGSRATITYMDALWRPVLKHEYDATNVGPTLRAVKTGYDSSGRVSFQSYPSSDMIPGASGIRTFYDALDRVTRVEQDSELGVLPTTTEYLTGLKTRVTNPRGFQTTTSFMAWDQPGYDLPILSEQPEGKVIEIVRHPQFGWPQQLKQRNTAGTLQQSRQYVYDTYGQLCKTIEPETGATVMDYDAAGNLSWSATGLIGATYTGLNDCSQAAAGGSGRVAHRAYDARNRLTNLAFPNGRGNQVWSYTPDGLPASITTYNESDTATPVVNGYSYNRRRLMTGESIYQAGWYNWATGYGYDAYGHLSLQTYHTGLNVDFAPNVYGQPTKAGTFASGAQYYPNGALKQFTYGNGIVHTMTQNARQLPVRVTATGNAMDYDYAYDPNGNVERIYDYVTGTPTPRHRWMGYDGLDRLTSTASAVFGGTDNTHRFTYDALDNMTSWKLAGVKDYADYVYDASTHRLTNIRNTAGATVVGMDYDEQGNLRNKNGQAYEFDYGNRLRNVPGKESYRYDGHGRRVLSLRPDGSNILSMYGFNGQVVLQDHGTKVEEHIYLAGSIVATRVKTWATGGTYSTRYQHTDALGSPVAVSDEAGQVIERNDYEPYGAIIGKPTFSGIGYTGHVMDGVTGLTYMQQRYYDESIGRFLSVDPVVASSGTGANFNRYWYADSNPYKFTDPDGRAAETVWDAANLAIGGASLVKNIAIGNYLGAAVDAAGLVVDGAATAVPFVPGGAGTAIKAYRLSHVAVDGGRAAKTASGASRTVAVETKAASIADRAGSNSVSVRTSDGLVRYDLRGAAHHSKVTNSSVPTPHVQQYANRVIPSGPRAGQVGSVTRTGDVRSATHADLRVVERVLDRRNKP